MTKEFIHDVYLFIDGVASVCDDANIIAEKALARFGKNKSEWCSTFYL